MAFCRFFMAGIMAVFSLSQALAQQPVAEEISRLTLPRFSYPTFSPDGTKVLYESQTGGNWDIYTMGMDGLQDGGGNIRRLTHNSAGDRMPAFSPDGSSIAFISDRDGDFDLFVMNADGSGERRLADNEVAEIHPFWSPDGKQILFNRRHKNELIYDIFAIAPDGSGETLVLADGELNSYAQMSPDGTMIAFDKWVENDSSNGEIYVLSLADKSLVRLTDNAVYDGYPTWTPDGRIIYSSEIGEDFKLFAIDPDGKNRTQLTLGDGSDARADVSADGKQVIFNRDIADSINIYIIPLASD